MDNKELTNKIIQMSEADVEMKSDIKYIIKTLEEHVSWESEKYKEMDEKFASKEYEKLLKITDAKVERMPEKLVTRFAEKWVETWTKAVAFTIIGSVSIAVILKIIM